MRALLYTESFDLEVCEVEPPRPSATEVLLAVEAAGICASDVHGVLSRSPRRTPPLVMGHELCGRVVDAGGPAGRHLVGVRVAVNPQVTCGDCTWCRSGLENICGRRGLIGGTRAGGFAEMATIPLRCAHPIAADITAETAVFAEPLATCVHALSLARENLASTAVVLGAGAIGALAAQLLRVAGAEQIIVSDPVETRHAGLHQIADVIVTPEALPAAVEKATDGVGADLAIDAVGTSGSRPDSLGVLRGGGCAIWLGMHSGDATISGFDVVVREQRVLGSFAYTDGDFTKALGLLSSRRFVPAVSRRCVTLDDSAATFRRLLDGTVDSILKEIVVPRSTTEVVLGSHLDGR